MTRSRGFTLIELIVVLAVLLIVASVCLADRAAARRTAQQIQNSTQLRGIHQRMVIFAQSNKQGSTDGWFPGISAAGKVEHTDPGKRHQLLVEGSYYTPEYAISPVEDGVTAWPEQGDMTHAHHSYAMLQIEDPHEDEGRYKEWSETINTAAVVLSDRNTRKGEGRGSIWTTDPKAGWSGTVTRNDNSTSFEKSSVIAGTKYHTGNANDKDDLFEAEGAFDAMMTFAKDRKGEELAIAPRVKPADDRQADASP